MRVTEFKTQLFKRQIMQAQLREIDKLEIKRKEKLPQSPQLGNEFKTQRVIGNDCMHV